MNLRNWSGRTLTLARSAFPDPIDLLDDVHLETRSGNHAGDTGFKRRMGRSSRVKVRRFLVDAGLATWDPHARLLKAEPPPSGKARQAWISEAYWVVGAVERLISDTMSDPNTPPQQPDPNQPDQPAPDQPDQPDNA